MPRDGTRKSADRSAATLRPRRGAAFREPLVATYSIVARDPATGHLGVAVQSYHFSVGSLSPYAQAGVGAVTIQAFAKLYYGSDGLRLMHEGARADATLEALLARDHHSDYRQVAVVDRHGGAAAHTGRLCVPAAGHHIGDGYACQGNMLAREDTWHRMAEAFEGAEGPLHDRMVRALEAGDGMGGDLRGKRSAALIVVNPEYTGDPEADVTFDLRVEDDDEPLAELKRLICLKTAFHHNGQGAHFLRHGQYEAAVAEFSKAESLAPNRQELVFWRAVALLNAGHADEAESLFRRLFQCSESWRQMVERIAQAGFLPDKESVVQVILRL